MDYTIAHELPGRIRLRVDKRFSAAESAAIDALLRTQPGIKSSVSSWRTGSILLTFEPEQRDRVLLTVKALTPDYYRDIAAQHAVARRPTLVPAAAAAARPEERCR